MTEAILRRIWDRLEEAATSRSPFNFLQLATVGLDGSPQLRMIVLRQCHATDAALSFVTDMRSHKVKEILRDPRVSLVGFDPIGSIQLRLEGRAAIVSDEAERRGLWKSLRHRTLIVFEAPLAPGTAIDDAGRPRSGTEPPTDLVDPYDRFALVKVSLSRLEWLDLSATEHVRCAFERHVEGWEGSWLAP